MFNCSLQRHNSTTIHIFLHLGIFQKRIVKTGKDNIGSFLQEGVVQRIGFALQDEIYVARNVPDGSCPTNISVKIIRPVQTYEKGNIVAKNPIDCLLLLDIDVLPINYDEIERNKINSILLAFSPGGINFITVERKESVLIN